MSRNTNQQFVPVTLSSYHILIYDKSLWNRNCCCSSADWKPFDRILVVERPRGNDGEECECGAAKSDVDSKLDVLQEVSDEEGDGLDVRC
jgi:hypothetical protein